MKRRANVAFQAPRDIGGSPNGVTLLPFSNLMWPAITGGRATAQLAIKSGLFGAFSGIVLGTAIRAIPEARQGVYIVSMILGLFGAIDEPERCPHPRLCAMTRKKRCTAASPGRSRVYVLGGETKLSEVILSESMSAR